MQIAGCKDERLEAQDGLYTDRIAMGSFFSAHSAPALRIFLSRERHFGRVGLYVYRSRLHDSVPDVRCPVGGSRETCQKPERAERTGYRLPTDVPETVLLRR